MTKFADLFDDRPWSTTKTSALDRAPADWAKTREPLRPNDRTLSPLAQRWIEGLAPEHRPLHLAADYPRIANRVALCWSDAQLTAQVFDLLLSNQRGAARRGFPAPVVEELRQLRRLRPAPAAGKGAGSGSDVPWSIYSLATQDR